MKFYFYSFAAISRFCFRAISASPRHCADSKAGAFAIALSFILFFTIDSRDNIAQSLQPKFAITSSNTQGCSTDIAELTTQLLKDIPDYSNRVLKRTQDSHFDAGIDTYIVIAGQPELKPLNLPQIEYDPTNPEAIKQIFFTTLERQYQNQQKIERETYHWLFVTMANDGWYLVTMFSRYGDAKKNMPPSPPIESSDGIIGQAVSLWLRDCRASLVSL